MQAVLWELPVGVLGLILGGLLIAGHGYLIGGAFLAASTAWLAYRMEFVNPGKSPGAFSLGRAYLDGVRTAIVWTILIAVAVFLFIGSQEHWSQDLRGQVATFALSGLAFFLLKELKRVSDSALARLEGGAAEECVVHSLQPLRNEGWTVENNLMRDDGWGDVDVVVRDPRGRVFAIETKSRELRRKDIRQALGNAAWLHRHLGNVRWVNAVVCVPGDVPARLDGKAWIVGAGVLADWLRTARV